MLTSIDVHNIVLWKAYTDAPIFRNVKRLQASRLRGLRVLGRHGGCCAQPAQRLAADDYRAALQIWLLVFTPTLPLVIPFLLFDSPQTAVRISHALAVAIMFVLGLRLGRWIGARPWMAGLTCAVLGMAIAAACMALGG